MSKDNINTDPNLEMLCPKCKSEMKEFVTTYRCRNLNCRLSIKKYFQIKQ